MVIAERRHSAHHVIGAPRRRAALVPRIEPVAGHLVSCLAFHASQAARQRSRPSCSSSINRPGLFQSSRFSVARLIASSSSFVLIHRRFLIPSPFAAACRALNVPCPIVRTASAPLLSEVTTHSTRFLEALRAVCLVTTASNPACANTSAGTFCLPCRSRRTSRRAAMREIAASFFSAIAGLMALPPIFCSPRLHPTYLQTGPHRTGCRFQITPTEGPRCMLH